MRFFRRIFTFSTSVYKYHKVLLQGKPLSPKDPRALYFSSFLAGVDEFVSEHRSGEYDRYRYLSSAFCRF